MPSIRTLRELVFLQRLSVLAGATLDARELVDLVIAETTEAADTDVCSIYLASPDGTLVLAATNGLSQAGVGRVRLAIGEGVTGWAAADRSPVVVPDVRGEPRFVWLPEVDQARFVSMCSVPIISGDRLVGVLNVQTDRHREFSDGEVQFLSAIAAQVAGTLERTELQRRLEQRLADLHRSEEIHKRFTELALAGAGLDAICAGIEFHAGAPVAVFDEDGHRIGASASGDLPERLTGYADPDRRDDGLALVPVRAGREVLGWLALEQGEPGDGHSRRLAAEHGATVIALEMVRARAEAEAERRLRGDLLAELLSVRVAAEDAQHLVRQAARLGIRLGERVWVVVVGPDDQQDTDAGATQLRRAARAIGRLAEDADGIAVSRSGSFVLLVPGDRTLDVVVALAEAAVATARTRGGAQSWSAGICGRPAGAAELYRLHREAIQTLSLVRRAGRRGSVGAYARLGIDRLLLDIDDDAGLVEFVEEWLGPLERNDASGPGAAPLVPTLEALVAAGWSLRTAARRLQVHINTLHYRIDRIRTLTERELDDPDVRLSFSLALRARRLLAGLDDSSRLGPGESRITHPYSRPAPRISVGIDGRSSQAPPSRSTH